MIYRAKHDEQLLPLLLTLSATLDISVKPSALQSLHPESSIEILVKPLCTKAIPKGLTSKTASFLPEQFTLLKTFHPWRASKHYEKKWFKWTLERVQESLTLAPNQDLEQVTVTSNPFLWINTTKCRWIAEGFIAYGSLHEKLDRRWGGKSSMNLC